MALFNKFKKVEQKKEEPKPEIMTSEQAYDYAINKFNQYKSSETRNSVNSRLSDFANREYNDMLERNFREKYRDINNFITTFRLGIGTDSIKNQMSVLQFLESIKLLNQNDIERLELPCLLEREELGIITNRERQKLEKMKQNIDVYSTYRVIVTAFDAMGLQNIEDKEAFSKSFAKYGALNEKEEISRMKFHIFANRVLKEYGYDENQGMKR